MNDKAHSEEHVGLISTEKSSLPVPSRKTSNATHQRALSSKQIAAIGMQYFFCSLAYQFTWGRLQVFPNIWMATVLGVLSSAAAAMLAIYHITSLWDWSRKSKPGRPEVTGINKEKD